MQKHGTFLSMLLAGSLSCCCSPSIGQQTTPAKSPIAVLNFDGRGISESEVATLTDRLRGHLVNTSAFVVLDRGNMEEILKEFGFQQSGCTSTECAVEVGKMLNVQKMVTGSIGKVGKTYTIDISIVDVESSRIERSLSKDYRGEIDDLLAVLKTIAYELAGIKENAKAHSLNNATPSTTDPAKAQPAAMETRKLYRLSISSSPRGAEVIVNNRSIGKTPLARKTAEGGSFKILLRYPGYQDWEKSLTIFSDQDLRVELAPRSDSASAPLRMKTMETERGPDSALRPNAAKEAERGKQAKSSSRKWLYIAGGAAAVGAAAAILFSSGDDSGNRPLPETLPAFKWPPDK